MPSLPELQESFACGLFGPDRAIAVELLGARGQDGEAGLVTYRNNVLANYRNALRETYPVVLRLIGEACFDQLARAHARAMPSRSGDLYDFGADFAGTLGAHPSTRGLPYLPDVARLEWALEGADRAPEAAPLDLARLAQVPAQQWDGLRFVLHPSARLLASPWPVLRIWQVNQPGGPDDATVDLAEGGVRLLVIRRESGVQAERQGAAEYALLAALADDAGLGAALEAALAAEPDFDLNPFLQRHAAARTLVDFRDPTRGSPP